MAIEPTPLDGTESKARMPFLAHMEALRWHLIRSVIAIALVTIGVFVYLEEFVTYVIMGPLQPEFPTNRLACYLDSALCSTAPIFYITLQAISPTEQFSRAISIGLTAGFVLAFPYVVWEFWRFIKPGLRRREVGTIRGGVGVVSLLFFSGIAFTYFVILPFTLRFLASFQIMPGIQNDWRIGDLISLIVMFCLAGGLLFQMPVLTWILSQLGILKPRVMRKYRRHAIVAILILAGILTPSPDALSQLLLAMPIIVLYEVSIGISARVQRRKEAAHQRFMTDEA